MPVIAYDQREGNNAIPMLAPDPSLKTTDPFYGGIQHPDNSGPSYQLPPIFGGPAPIILDWMNLSEHNEKLNMTTKNIVAINSYALTEDQMSRAGIPVGEENYL
ncbi:hypothetical protein M0R72_15805 [Candidatus Pacearchaeota archaeon]|nr:hypothetical protein [Candidatus Pacearchaeota archaeon]